MQELKARPFVNAVRALAVLEEVLRNGKPEQKKEKVSHPTAKIFLAPLEEFSGACDILGATLSRMAAEELIGHLKSDKLTYVVLHEEVRHLHKYFERHLVSAKLFALHSDDAPFYDQAVTRFGDDVLKVFPLASSEIDEAGKCIALGRAPAAVFHMMRIAEIGLRAVAPLVGITNPNPDWGSVVRKVDEEIKLPKSQQKPSLDYSFLADVSSHMHAVKLAWRNQVMHVDATFSLDNARDIFNAMRALMQHLASGLSAPSSP